MNDYLRTLFEVDSVVSVARTVEHCRVTPLEQASFLDGQFISVNSFKSGTTWRMDKDCWPLRNFLVEWDKIPLELQDTLVKEIGLPYSTKVFSGGKSYHYVISLEDQLKDHEEYAALATFMIDDVLPGGVDRANKNPSRLTRLPGVVRLDTGKEQTLLECKGRVKNQTLFNFLSQYVSILGKRKRQAYNAEIRQTVRREMMARGDLPNTFMSLINERTKRFLNTGAVEGDRHNETMLAVKNLYESGAESDVIRDLLEPIVWQIGIGDRGDLEQLIDWAERVLVPYV